DRGDTLVLNRSKVLPARFIGRNLATGGKVEGLWLHDAPTADGADTKTTPHRRIWIAMIKARRHTPGRVIELTAPDGSDSGVRLELLGRAEGEPGAWRVAAWSIDEPGLDTPAMLARAGRPPLPPYIRHARRDSGQNPESDEQDRDRYQTVYAGPLADPGRASAPPGSVAAPTAGLHFTHALLEALRHRGIDTREIVLHVGAGTFKPVEVDDLNDHPMHSEWCSMPADVRDAVFSARRVIAVGTTSARTIEAYAARLEQPDPVPEWIETDLLIAPGYRWHRVDGLLTNFHLPRSTLLALVAAMLPEGIDRLRAVYAEAIGERYRFYSFGDAMLILP
ncbi:MAG TPA: S-adenosylmethionine:tRNA ribosyltransferase-isomerase, partial [Phycisphaerales bacterium]|nr:S-adenosylmethionine:tRNA ribosyltransferase-isomerase [Phycisphaerales bacterium]